MIIDENNGSSSSLAPPTSIPNPKYKKQSLESAIVVYDSADNEPVIAFVDGFAGLAKFLGHASKSNIASGNTRLRGGFYAKKWDTVPPDSYSIFQSGWLELQEKIANPEVQAKQRLLKHQNKPNQTSRGALWGVMKDGREIVIDGKDTLTASEIASWFDSQNGTKGSKGKISEHMRSGTPYKGYKFVSK